MDIDEMKQKLDTIVFEAQKVKKGLGHYSEESERVQSILPERAFAQVLPIIRKAVATRNCSVEFSQSRPVRNLYVSPGSDETSVRVLGPTTLTLTVVYDPGEIKESDSPEESDVSGEALQIMNKLYEKTRKENELLKQHMEELVGQINEMGTGGGN